MIETSYINPFSTDAKEIVSQLGQIENLDKQNQDLVTIIEDTRAQQLDDASGIPKTIKQLALHKYQWFLFKKTDKFNHKMYEYLFNPDIYEYDVVSFYLLMQVVAIEFGPDSHETKQVIELERDLINQRLEKLNNQPTEFQNSFLRETLNQLIDTNNLYWYNIKELLTFGELELDKLLISNGKVIVEYEDFMEEYGNLIENRRPMDMYEVSAGKNLKFNLLKSIIMLYTKQYINTVSEMSKKMVEPNPLLAEMAGDIREIQQKSQELRFGKNSGNYNNNDNQPVTYQLEALPPCARKCLRGIKSGGRNDAIVLFLTPLVSYARLCPGVFAQDRQIKISEVDPSLDITLNEVIPLIYDAAQACRPPLFKDQPQEKININSKLGFGMHDELKIDHEGETRWYTPMSCEKIKLHMPSLCTPNIDCKKIGNPLTYYNRKRKLLKRENNKNNGASE